MRWSEIGVAVVGAGFIGPVHVEALRRLGLWVTGILGCDERESQDAAHKLNLPKAYRSFEEVLGDPAVASVHLAVPNVLHYPMARQALEAGKHVMCEKPLGMNSRETRELMALAKRSGKAAGVCYNIRFYPLNLQAREMVRAGELGEITLVTGSYVQDWLLYPTDYNWRVLADQGGALRAVADIGTHWMDLVSAITGLEIEAVMADLKTVQPVRLRPRGEVETFTGKLDKDADEREPIEVTTEDYGAVLLRFRGGARGVFHVSQVTAGRKNCLRYEISGSRAAVAWDSEDPNRLWIGSRDEANRVLTRDPALLAAGARHYANYPGGHNEGFPDTFKQCFRAFYHYIVHQDSAAPEFPSFADGHREVLLCEAILRSHREQAWIPVEGGES
ncbi:MAG: Gfo/Idh/MocA family oxidoreductase [Acidobacteriota bacterium]